MAKKMNDFIPEKWDDMVFFFAEEIYFNKKSGWDITINPDNCRVGMKSLEKDMPDIATLRKEKPQKCESKDGSLMCGRILLSAGVIFFVENKLVLFRRDEQAPVAPLKWTTPAGRLDRAPLYCALKEFYEELIMLDEHSGKPVFFQIPGLPYANELRTVYEQTLKRKGENTSQNEWLIIDCEPGVSYFTDTQPVSVRFECETISSFEIRFWPIYDEENNTLELMLPLTVESQALVDIKLLFKDGEYQRINKLYELDEFLRLSDTDLVNTAIILKDHLNASLSMVT